MILMTSQSCATSKGFLTIGIRTFVWSFAGMDPSMPGQGAGIAKWLRNRSQSTNNGLLRNNTDLTTPLAHMRLLTSMYTRMYSQG